MYSKKIAAIFSFIAAINAITIGFCFTANAEKISQDNVDSDYGLPTHRRDGGSRSANSCISSNDSKNLVALIPETTVGMNASTSPKLFFYVPKVQKQKTLEFVLRNEQDELIYEAFLTTEGEGIMSVDIPADVNADQADLDANYHWYLSMICNSQQRSRDIVVEGWMRQSNINTVRQKQLNNADLITQAEIYQQDGYWFDALSTLALAGDRQSEIEEPIVKAKWFDLLESVGLEELAEEPFVESELVRSSIVK
ncbi:MAG: DUF928 domain-containing protein [Cyanobacteria bacterium P01_G01_bin.19]